MNCLLISDLHLTSNQRDEYRWNLFTWLTEIIPKHDVKDLFILGDITDAKDYHPARLVNRVVDTLIKLYQQTSLHHIHILRGNHDGIDPGCSYFRFLGKYPSIKFIETPYMFPMGSREILMLPHTKDPATAWGGVDLHIAELIFMHATVTGAVAENGQALQEGVPIGLLRAARRATIYSGDVHVPQKCGPVEYVGAPYPIRFGDSFKPRAILLENYRKATSLYPPTIRKVLVKIDPSKPVEDFFGKIDLSSGDQLKARVRLTPSEYGDWQSIKKTVSELCAALNVELCGLELERVQPKIQPRGKGIVAQPKVKTPTDILNEHCVKNKLDPSITATGISILNTVVG